MLLNFWQFTQWHKNNLTTKKCLKVLTPLLSSVMQWRMKGQKLHAPLSDRIFHQFTRVRQKPAGPRYPVFFSNSNIDSTIMSYLIGNLLTTFFFCNEIERAMHCVTILWFCLPRRRQLCPPGQIWGWWDWPRGGRCDGHGPAVLVAERGQVLGRPHTLVVDLAPALVLKESGDVVMSAERRKNDQQS